MPCLPVCSRFLGRFSVQDCPLQSCPFQPGAAFGLTAPLGGQTPKWPSCAIRRCAPSPVLVSWGRDAFLVHGRNVTVAAEAGAQVFAHQSWRIAKGRQFFRLPNMISIPVRRFTGLPRKFRSGMYRPVPLSCSAFLNPRAAWPRPALRNHAKGSLPGKAVAPAWLRIFPTVMRSVRTCCLVFMHALVRPIRRPSGRSPLFPPKRRDAEGFRRSILPWHVASPQVLAFDEEDATRPPPAVPHWSWGNTADSRPSASPSARKGHASFRPLAGGHSRRCR